MYALYIKAGVGLHHDIHAGFLYDCPWYTSCARETGMIQVKGCFSVVSQLLHRDIASTVAIIPLLKNDFGTDTSA